MSLGRKSQGSYCAGTVLAGLVISWSAIPARAGEAPRSGDRTVAQVCSVCHGSGLMGAPKIGDNGAWSARLSQAGSVDALTAVAEQGKGSMPPRGGQSALTDADLKAAVVYMLGKSGLAP